MNRIIARNGREWARRLSCWQSLTEAKKNLSRTYIFVGLSYFILFCAVLLPIGNLLSLGFKFEINYNEGWNVYNADRLIHGTIVYDDDYWRINNYPIGSFLIIAAANVLFHDLLLSGRLVALVSFAAIAVFAAMAVRRFGGGRTDAVFGAGCAMGFCYLVAPAWIIADDPQTLGEAVMLGALVSYIARPPDRLNLLRTAFLVVLGGFVKHNLLAIPIAITLDLAFRSPRRLPLWLVSCAGFAAGFLGLTQIVAGGDFIGHLMSPRLFGWYGARYHLMKYLRLFKFPLTVIALSASLFLAADRMILAAWGIDLDNQRDYPVELRRDLLQHVSGRRGVPRGRRRCHDVRVAQVRVSRPIGQGAVDFTLPFVAAQPILARAPDVAAQVYHGRALLDADRKRQETFLADAKYVADRQGPAICESLLLCYVAGQPFILDPFNSRQYMLSGRLDQGELIRRIAAREFAVIQLRADICDDPATPSCHILHYRQKVDRFTDEVLYAIDRYYKIGRRSTFGSFYVPK